MSIRKGFPAGLIVAVLALFVAALPVAAQISGADQRFVDGLEKRGLLRLQQLFLDDVSKTSGAGGMDLVKEQQAKLYENQGARSGDEIERDKLFKQSKDLYRELLDQMTKALAAATEVRVQDDLHMRLLTMKVHLAELIWQREATNQLTNLELTDRQSGNRAKVQSLLREATALFLEINKDATEWSAQLQTDDKRMSFVEPADRFKEYSNYQIGWTSYYLAYVLPTEDKDREKLLKDAIDRFTPFTIKEDDFPARWESFKGLGMCYREQGKFDDAVKNLRRAIADDAKTPSNEFRISVYYELSQTYIKAKQFVEARQAIDEMKAKKYPKMEETLYGGTILPFIEAKILLSEGQTDSAKKDQGLAAMRQLWDKAVFWHLLVAPEVSRYIDKTQPVEKMNPFEIWILADAAFGKADYKDAAKFFEQYVKITPPTDVGHPQAKYDLAACYFKLADGVKGAARTNLLRMAANGFEEVAAGFPNFEGASRAAKYAVEIKGMLAEADPGAQAVEDVAKSWEAMIKARPEDAKKNDAEWYLAQVRLKQNRFHEAAEHFARVPTDSPGDHYFDALFMEIHSLRRDWWEVQSSKDSAEELKRAATVAVGKMEEYVKKAQAVTQPPSAELKAKLRDNAAQALIWAGEILGSDRIQEYQRALVLLDRCEKDYGDVASKGDILKVKIDCHRGQGQLDKARADLEGLLQTKQDLQGIFQSLFASFTEEVSRLIGNGKLEEARKKVAMADDIGKMFTDYLAKSTDKNAGAQIETVRAQLAELHLEAEDLDGPTGALERYKALLGFDPADLKNAATHNNKEIKMDYLVGLAKASTALGRQQVDSKDAAKAPEAYTNLKNGVFYWSQVCSGYEQQVSDKDPQVRAEAEAKFWAAKLAQSQTMVDYLNDLEQKFGKDPKTDYLQLVKEFLKIRMATGSSFGGPALKIQWKRLGDKVGIAIP